MIGKILLLELALARSEKKICAGTHVDSASSTSDFALFIKILSGNGGGHARTGQSMNELITSLVTFPNNRSYDDVHVATSGVFGEKP